MGVIVVMPVFVNGLTSHVSTPRLAALVLVALAAAKMRDASPLGVWLTPVDRKGQVAHVMARPCGSFLCGSIARISDKSGAPVAAPTVGQKVFWNMAPDGNAFRGRAYVPSPTANMPQKCR